MARTLIAVAGALVITVLLLLAMNEVVSKFRERDGTRYFLVDFIAPVETGRQRVQRLEVPESTTERVRPEVDNARPRLDVEAPRVESSVVEEPPVALPELDASTVER